MSFPWTAPSRPKTAPPPVQTTRDADVKWSRSYTARLARVAILEAGWRPIVATFARPEKKGLEGLKSLDPKKPVIFTANHRSHADTPILLTSIPEPWRHKLLVGAAKDYFFTSPAVSAFFALTIGAIPIERTKLDRSSSQLISQLISNNWSLLIYPEGGRSPDGWGKPFHAGAAYLSTKHQVPVVPIYLEGTRHILPRGRYFPQVGKSSIIFGSPIYPQEEESTRALARKISASTDALADELSSDWWQARKREHRGNSPTTSGPDTVSWRRSWNLSQARNFKPKSPHSRSYGRQTAKNPWL